MAFDHYHGEEERQVDYDDDHNLADDDAVDDTYDNNDEVVDDVDDINYEVDLGPIV